MRLLKENKATNEINMKKYNFYFGSSLTIPYECTVLTMKADYLPFFLFLFKICMTFPFKPNEIHKSIECLVKVTSVCVFQTRRLSE